MAEPFVGQIMMAGFGFAPSGWALCNGQPMPMTQYATLGLLIGNKFGGDGVTTFNLPDMRSRIPVGAGQAPGMNLYTLGEQGGSETVPLQESHLPAHTHNLPCSSGPANQTQPGSAGFWAAEPSGQLAFYTDKPPDATMNPAAIGTPVMGGGAHQNVQPYTCISYCIAIEGVYPIQ